MGGSRVIFLSSVEEMFALGFRAASHLSPDSILALSGPLGSGKTSFIQGLAAGLKIEGPILSPTFQYVHVYEGALPLYHFDLYRMTGASDFFAMGFEEYFTMGGIVAIEWPERLGSLLPATAHVFRFSYEGTGRSVTGCSFLEEKLIESVVTWD
jgi:tRNA threonylcarbamoyladenosine biosynthesis protein TsaE